MAWLSGITGKAENFLNSLDQTAAKVLHETPGQNQSKYPTAETAPKDLTDHTPYLNQKPSSITPSQNVPSKFEYKQEDQSASANTDFIAQKAKSDPTATKKKMDKDEALFEFLNSPEPAERRKSTPASSTRHSRQSSASSVISNKGGRSENLPSSSSTSGSSMVHVEMPGTDSRHSPDNMDMAALEDAMQDQSPSNSVHGNQELESRDVMSTSSIDLENRLLKSEVASLNEEMAALVQRAKDSERDLTRLRERLQDQQRATSRAEGQVRELQGLESDLEEALRAKDSQLAVLRVRLEEADRETEARQKSLVQLKSEKSRILQDHTDSSGMHGQALDSLRQKLTEVEAALHREQEANKMTRQEVSDRQIRLEDEQRSFTEALTVAEKKYTDEKSRVVELTSQLKTLRTSLDSAKRELSEYKEKATRILQSKERLIASLREGSGASGEAAGVSSLEYDTVKQERDMFREEIQQARMNIENLRMEITDLEAQIQQETETARDEITSLEESMAEEKRRREEAEQELLKHKKELQYAIEEINKQKTSFQSQIDDREKETERLRTQLSKKSASSQSEVELESRVRDLTESLIHKQTMVEALSTEKNSLGLQLERLQQQYQDVQASSVRSNTTVIPVHEEEEVRHRLPMFMRETHTDSDVTRKMKRAANTIDRFSIRLGVFLRRYPIARVFVIVYMAVLHLWVTFVLLTYQPEIHGPTISVMPEAPAGTN
ncbi:golgin subfamily A member 5-like isoform X2 [Mya arenaria]|uniref:golgin subfamily A member 5-like isoform X2 n=1 Tax=Mya arenaria TaxID=6604 RepID=UPI0022E6A034|nr:golgin subfamily A member 5-like isoform X2 [Mya arenaria]